MELYRAAVICALALLLAACTSVGQTTDAHTPGASTPAPKHRTATPSPVPTATSASRQSILPQFNATRDGIVGNLRVHTRGIICGAWLTIKDPQATYDAAAIQAMATYIRGHAFFPNTWDANVSSVLGRGDGVQRSGFAYFFSFETPGTSDLPNTLQWLPGGRVCLGTLEITNQGSNPTVISSIGATLTTDAFTNATSYDLVSLCSLVGSDCPSPGGASVSCLYYAEITLQGGIAHDHLDAPLQVQTSPYDGSAPCPNTLTLDPGAEHDVTVKFSSSPQHDLYQVGLTITVDGTTQQLPSTLDQYLAFVDDSTSFTCYGLRGDHFVVIPPDPQVNPTQVDCT